MSTPSDGASPGIDDLEVARPTEGGGGGGAEKGGGLSVEGRSMEGRSGGSTAVMAHPLMVVEHSPAAATSTTTTTTAAAAVPPLPLPLPLPPRARYGDSSSASSGSSSPPFRSSSAASAASANSPPETSSRLRDDRGNFAENAGSQMRKLGIKDTASDIASLQQLMRQGAWRAIVDKVKEAKRRSLSQTPYEQIVYATFYVLALMKLRSYGAASDELAALGDLNSQKYRFEQHSDLYPDKSGSMVPFGLRWLHAELPHRLGQTSTTIDHLYNLLAHCNDRIDFLQASIDQLSKRDKGTAKTNNPSSASSNSLGQEESPSSQIDLSGVPPGEEATLDEDGASEDVGSNFPSEVLDYEDFGDFVTSTVGGSGDGNPVYSTLINRWKRRQEVVLCSVLGHHLNQKDYLVCLKWLEDLVKRRPRDVVVLSKFGYVRLQVGDLYGARRTFATVEAICEQGRSSSPMISSLLARNRGLLYFSLKQYPKAVKEFDTVLEQDPGDVVAANNKALCLMYSRDLVGATQVLESSLQRNALTALNETLVLNLCSMYELASMNSVESKRTLSAWILRIAPDDFDLTCTRL